LLEESFIGTVEAKFIEVCAVDFDDLCRCVGDKMNAFQPRIDLVVKVGQGVQALGCIRRYEGRAAADTAATAATSGRYPQLFGSELTSEQYKGMFARTLICELREGGMEDGV
jgi:hypothetical protein